MSHAHRLRVLVGVFATVLFAGLLMAACGSDSSDGGSTAQPTVVVSTSVLGDVVGDLVGDRARVVTIMPPGASPHEFAPSARQVAEMADADAIIVNGAGLEGGLRSVIDNAVADGVPVYEAISAVDTRTFANGDVDPHFFTDPHRMAEAVRGIADQLRTAVPVLDDDAFATATDAEVADLEALDAEVADILGAVPPERRQLVTDHEVFGYFADRYGFEVVDTIVPTGSTADGASGAHLASLAATIDRLGLPAVFTSSSHSSDLADALAAEVGGLTVVPLFAESLGGPDSDAATYDAMIRTDAQRIADALRP